MSTPLDAEVIAATLAHASPEPLDLASIPAQPGFYAWWAKSERLADATPPIPVYPAGVRTEWVLLYVGIAPKRPSRTGVDRTIAARITKDRAAEDEGRDPPHPTLR